MPDIVNILDQALIEVADIHLKSAGNELLYAGDGKQKLIIGLYGPSTEQYARLEERQIERNYNRMSENEGKMPPLSSEQRIADTAEDLASITAYFKGFDYPEADAGGEQAKFRAFYADRRLTHFRNQIAKAMNDTGNWRPGKAGSA